MPTPTTAAAQHPDLSPFDAVAAVEEAEACRLLAVQALAVADLFPDAAGCLVDHQRTTRPGIPFDVGIGNVVTGNGHLLERAPDRYYRLRQLGSLDPLTSPHPTHGLMFDLAKVRPWLALQPPTAT